jgi:formiminotetrahydrofolate cyclodeaminase
MEAFRLPKETEEQRDTRANAVEAAMQQATLVPLQNARLCLEVLHLARRAADQGYEPSLSDAGVGALLAHAGVLGCLYNVQLNLQSVKDSGFAGPIRAEVDSLRSLAGEGLQAADRLVQERLTS